MEKNQYYPWFDWLRALLAITVMCSHQGLIAWEHGGNFPVQVFFALSGWLIGGILIKLKPSDLPRFYFNRALRIWVPYYIALFLLIAASLLKEPITAKWLEFIFYKLTFVYNLFGPQQLHLFHQAMPLEGTGNHFWSVNAEEQFYLLAPLLLVLTPLKFAKSTALWALIAILGCYFNVYPSILLGVLSAVAVHEFGAFQTKPLAQAIFAFLFLVGTYLLISGYSYQKTAPIIAISIIMLLARTGKQSNISEIAGGMSYPLYLNHWIGFFFAHAVLKPFGLRDSPAAHIMSIVLNIGLAVVMYLLIDKRIRTYRSQWFSVARGLLTTKIAYGMIVLGLIGGIYITR